MGDDFPLNVIVVTAPIIGAVLAFKKCGTEEFSFVKNWVFCSLGLATILFIAGLAAPIIRGELSMDSFSPRNLLALSFAFVLISLPIFAISGTVYALGRLTYLVIKSRNDLK